MDTADYEDLKAQALQDPELRKAYDALEQRYRRIRRRIGRTIPPPLQDLRARLWHGRVSRTRD